MNPRISIITITYNSEKTLEETIKSVVSQDYDNLEYLIIDGGSKDSTLEIVNKYRDRIAVVISEPDKGISDAFNKGIEHSTGEIIGIINSDDMLLPQALRAIADNYDKKIDVYRANTVLWNPETGSKIPIKPTMSFSNRKAIKSVCHQSTFIRKDAYEKYGKYDVALKYMMDADVLYRLKNKGARFKFIDQNLAVFRLGGITSDSWVKKLKESKYMIIKNGGSVVYAYYRNCIFIIRQLMKKVLFFFMGEETVRDLFYNGRLHF